MSKKYSKDEDIVKVDHQQALVDFYIKEIEERINDKSKWEKPFIDITNFPKNGKTGKEYTGINILHLASKKFADSRWYTFNQVNELSKELDLDISIIKGSKASYIVKAIEIDSKKEIEEITEDDEKKGKKLIFKYFPVFNGTQIKNLPPEKELENKVNWVEDIEKLKIAMESETGLKFIESGKLAAYYSPDSHTVHMSERKFFKSTEHYYDTLLHEIAHSTGKELGRDMSGKYGTKSYAKEELAAEFTSAFMSVKYGLRHNQAEHDNSIEYLKSWLQILKEDKTALNKAAKQASKSVKYQEEIVEKYEKRLKLEKSKDVDIQP